MSKQTNYIQPYLTLTKLLFVTFLFETLSLVCTSQQITVFKVQPELTNTITFAASFPDTADKKKFWRAAIEWTLVQAIPWASNRYIRKAPFAKISIQSIYHNFNPEYWEWDDNKFINNQLSHPYQGSLYFNAFRSNGYNFWQSAPAVFAGTYFWETICETHWPAPNDLINSSIGGIAMGEMSNRLSAVLLRKKKIKKKKILIEPIAFAINPMQGINRMTDYDPKKSAKSFYRDSTPAILLADAGLRFVSKNGNHLVRKQKPEIFGRFNINYGDPFTQFKEPFSNFSIVAEIGSMDSSVANILTIEGALYGKKMKSPPQSALAFSISVNYDFYNYSEFMFSSHSFLANLISRIDFPKNIQVQLKAGAGIIPLAAAPNPNMYYGEGRNYDSMSFN